MDLRFDEDFYNLLDLSFGELTGRKLGDHFLSAAAGAHWLYSDAAFGLLVHNRADDPTFIYGNRTAQKIFGYSWDELTGLPSRLSAAAPEQGERERFLNAVEREGFVSGYRGLRIAKDRTQFWIEDATVWQVRDRQGTLHGQAALLPRIVPSGKQE